MFSNVTHNGLRIVKITQLKLHFEKLHVKHSVHIVDKIAHNIIFGNDILTQYKCYLLNSARAIVLTGYQIPFKIFRSTVNLICPVICSRTTTIVPYEDIVLSALLDANAQYAINQNFSRTNIFKVEFNTKGTRCNQLHIG